MDFLTKIIAARRERLAATMAETTLEDIRAIVKEDGMRTLYEEGAIAVVSGDTSVEEMMRVCTLEE